jgi:flagellar protein FliL
MRKLLPVLLALIGLGAGAGAGIALRPAPPEMTETRTVAPAEPVTPPEYVRLSNQFVVPVVEGGRVAAMVILSLSLEVLPGSTEGVFAREPKLRDAFLQVLFDHANAGGFRGSFTDGSNLVILRQALREAAARVLGDMVTDVLIADIVRQDG